MGDSRLIFLGPTYHCHKVMVRWELEKPRTKEWDHPWLSVKRNKIVLQVHGKRDGFIAVEELTPAQARKIGRALLLAANEVEGRPRLRLVKKRHRW